MPFSVYAAMLSSQLIVTVAGRVPEFDVGPSCRESTVSDCLSMERFARDKLIKDWPSLTAHDRAMCDMEEKLSGPRRDERAGFFWAGVPVHGPGCGARFGALALDAGER